MYRVHFKTDEEYDDNWLVIDSIEEIPRANKSSAAVGLYGSATYTANCTPTPSN